MRRQGRRRSPPCMRWRGPRLVRGRPDRLPGRLAPRTARRGRTSARPAGFPAPPAFRSHLRLMPVSNGGSILTGPLGRPQGSAGIHFRFFRRPHFIHRRWLVIRIPRHLSTGLCTVNPQVPWITIKWHVYVVVAIWPRHHRDARRTCTAARPRFSMTRSMPTRSGSAPACPAPDGNRPAGPDHAVGHQRPVTRAGRPAIRRSP